MSKVVLVTGASGLVGHGIQAVNARSPRDDEKWVYASSRDADLTDYESTRAMFDKYKPTHVIHLAAQVGGLFKNLAKPVEMWGDNVKINDNVMRCSHELGVAKLVSCLSTCIFPDKTTYPINERMLHDGAPHSSNEPYAYAKRMQDVLSRAYRREYGSNFISIIPTNIYGPHDNYHLEDGHVVPALIHKFYLAKKENKPVTVFGTGKPLRQFIYSEDLAELLLWAMRKYEEEGPIILSVGEEDEVSIGDVVSMISKAIGFEGEIIYDSTKADGQFKKTADNSKLRTYLPDYKFTPMEEGIKKSVEWLVENYDSARK
ncbi:RmlD substrate binding domain/NAD dependent epimerase/dehydratase family/GDP-mannose 4,6 dehydratase/Polysaccharide biosynthesis protein, putative [Angomonas deanei]|uniref:GDP-L-fucose synthase n=1 Tax=Angomonas deanei TaxID=59799 RepID=A0A7G2CHM7_9TRYP|nr:RmlD substrate binding domain/NAD dependent epimerase/dehydratase family/GDP-mannose 4,6 dehydratase/Polysaccharide biosynthesis protein, putative [Angomonas deanei]